MWWLIPVGGALFWNSYPSRPPPPTTILWKAGLWALGASTATYVGLAATEGLHNRLTSGAFSRNLQEQGRYYTLPRSTLLATHGGLSVIVVGLNLSVFLYCQQNPHNALWLADSYHKHWTLLVATFCHVDIKHLANNMSALVPEIPHLLHICGQSPYQFTAFYVTAAIFSSYMQRTLSYTKWSRSWISRFDITAPRSLGASGVAMAVFAASCFAQPWFAPSFVISACTLGWQIRNDINGLTQGGERIGYAAHLSGAAFGAAYAYCNVNHYVWSKLVRLFSGKAGGTSRPKPPAQQCGNRELDLDGIVRRLNSLE